MKLFKTSCKACEEKDQQLAELQDKFYAVRGTASDLARKAAVLQRENPDVWNQYFGSGVSAKLRELKEKRKFK